MYYNFFSDAVSDTQSTVLKTDNLFPNLSPSVPSTLLNRTNLNGQVTGSQGQVTGSVGQATGSLGQVTGDLRQVPESQLQVTGSLGQVTGSQEIVSEHASSPANTNNLVSQSIVLNRIDQISR